MTLVRAVSHAHLEAVTRAERNLYLAELEKLLVLEYTALHLDGDAWDQLPPDLRRGFAIEFGIDPRAADAVAHLMPVDPPPAAGGCFCGGSGIRCCELGAER